MPRNRAGAIAAVIGIDMLVSVLTLALFFVVGGPFGAINDWTIGIGGALTALLVVSLDRSVRVGFGVGVVTGLAVVGSFVVVVGAGLVNSDATGFLLAGLVESFGFALVGIWLIALNLAGRPGSASPLQILGVMAGGLMAIGLIVLPAIVARVDDFDTAPAYVWLGFIGWLGIFALYPVWAIWFGRGRPSAV
jgi:hypothetical protein